MINEIGACATTVLYTTAVLTVILLNPSGVSEFLDTMAVKTFLRHPNDWNFMSRGRPFGFQ